MSENVNEEKKQYTVQILSMLPVPAREPDRFGEYDYVIMCRVGNNKVVTVRIPAKDLTLDKIREAVIAELKRLKQFEGVTFTVEV